MGTEISKVIFQLETQAKDVATEMAKVATNLRLGTKAMEDQSAELKKLQDKELGLIELRKKSNNPSAVVNLTKAIEKNRVEIDKIAATQKKVNVETKEYAKDLTTVAGKLDKAFNKQLVNNFEGSLKEVQIQQQKLNETISDPAPANSLRGLQQEYKRLVASAIQAGENTDIGKNFLKQAGEVKDRIGDIQAVTKAFGSDTAIFDGVIGGVQGVAAGFEIAQGAAALFGDENEDVQKALLKVNAAMAIANGLQQIQALLQKESAFRIQATAAAQKLYNLVVGEGTKATKIFNAALKIGALGAIIFLIQKFSAEIEALGDKLKKSSLGKFFTDLTRDINKENQDRLTKEIENTKLVIEANENKYRRLIYLAKANGEDTEKLENEKLEAQLKALNNVNSTILGATKGHLFSLTQEQKKAGKELIEQTKDLENEVAVIIAEARQRRIEADKKLNAEIIELRIANIKDDRERSLAEINEQSLRRAEEVKSTLASEKLKTLALVEIEKNRQKQIDKIIDDARLKRNSDASKDRGIIEETDEAVDPQARIEQLKAREKEERRIKNEAIAQDIEDINTVTQATLNAAEQVISIEIRKQDALLEIQNKRVAQAALIADKGNAEILQQEQERLDALQKKREAFVRAQQILQQVEIVGNSIVAVSKAAAQGGVAAPATIAATIAALIAGFALVRTLTQPEGFREGGYTGDGDPSQESKRLGNRGYKYHKKEFVFNEGVTAKNLNTFRKIHNGELNLNAELNKAKLFDQIPMPILNNLLIGNAMRQAQNNVDTSRMESIMKDGFKSLKNKEAVAFHFSEKGYLKRTKELIFKEERIKNAAG